MNLDLFKGGAIAGVLIGFWDKIKTILWKLISTVIQRVEITTEKADEAVIGYLVNVYKPLSTYDKSYGARNESMRNGKYGLVPYEKYGNNSMLFLTNKKVFKLLRLPFFYNKHSNTSTDEHQYQSSNGTKIISTITCLRRTLDLDEIILEAAKMKNNLSWKADEEDKSKNRFDIYYLPSRDNSNSYYSGKHSTGFAWYRQNNYRLLGLTTNDIGRPLSSSGNALSNLFYLDKVKDLIDVISLWVRSKDWYKQKNIPWKKAGYYMDLQVPEKQLWQELSLKI